MRRLIGTLPGFRTGRWWKSAIAILGYALIGMAAIFGVTSMLPTVTALAIGALVVAMLAFDAGGLRRRIPGLRSRSPLVAAGSWIVVLGLMFAASAATDSVVFSPETRAARDAKYARIAADTAARDRAAAAASAARDAAAAAASSSTPTASPTPTPSPSPTPTPSPTSPTPTPSPTSPTPTPSPTRSPILIISLSANIVSTDTGVRATASLRDVTPAAGGTVRYAVYNDAACGSGPTVDAGTKPVAGGSVAPSEAITFENAGSAYWRAAYSGDGANPALLSDCRPLAVTLPPPVAYQIQTRSDVSIFGRKRTSVNVIVPGEPTKGQKIATLAAIARAELRAADVVYIKAWRSTADQELSSCSTITIGAAELSADGRGWAANQNGKVDTIAFGPDNGQIQGKVELPPLDRIGCPTRTEQFTTPR